MRPRPAFTLVELLVSLALAGVTGAFMLSTLVRQQRFYVSTSEILDARAQLRDAADILATDIRATAVDLGVPVMRDSAMEMFTIIASSIVCTAQSEFSFGLPPLRLRSGTSLTSMLAQPDTGDLALVHTTQWELQRISSFATRSMSTACPASSAFTEPADAISGNPAFEITVAGPTANPVEPGAPLIFVRRSRYSLYRSSDNKWYLGYRRCNAFGPPACATVQPVSGPYDPHPGGAPGLSFRYFDKSGTELGPSTDGRALSRVDVVLRGRSARRAGLSGNPGGAWSDSLVVSVAIRNRAR